MRTLLEYFDFTDEHMPFVDFKRGRIVYTDLHFDSANEHRALVLRRL